MQKFQGGLEKLDLESLESFLSLLSIFGYLGKGTKNTADRGTQRKYSSKPLKRSIVKRVLAFKQWIWAYFYPL